MNASRIATALFLAVAATAAARQPPSQAPSKGPTEWTQEPATFLGMTLGGGFPDSLSDCPILPTGGPDYAAMLHGPSCLIKMSEEIKAIWNPPNIGIDYSASAFLSNGKIRAIYLKLHSNDFTEMRKLLVLKYGEPSKTADVPVKTAAGGDFTSEEDNWTGKHVSILLSERANTVDHASVYVTDNDLAAKVQAENNKKEDEAASKF